MGNTIWVDERDKPKGAEDRQDCSIMLRLEKQLDRLCKNLKVPRLSAFYDYSGLVESNWDMVEEVSAEFDLPPPQKEWFDSSQGLAAVRAVQAHLQSHPEDLKLKVDSSNQHWPARLMEELEHCQTLLEKAVERGHEFRFLIVE